MRGAAVAWLNTKACHGTGGVLHSRVHRVVRSRSMALAIRYRHACGASGMCLIDTQSLVELASRSNHCNAPTVCFLIHVECNEQ